MNTPLRILCVHGVGHSEADRRAEAAWRDAIKAGFQQTGAGLVPEMEFVAYDDLFAADPITPLDIAEAMLKLGASGVVHGIGDFVSGLFGRARGLSDIGDTLRWTAGMVVQWAENDALRASARQRVLDHTQRFQPHAILAHSLGSLLSYDAFCRPKNSKLITGRTFVSFGSQIGNPFVRSSVAFNGRIEPLHPRAFWFHLYNIHDDAFAAPIRLRSANFAQVTTEFDIPGVLDHDAIQYLSHPNTRSTVWPYLAGLAAPRTRAFAGAPKFRTAMKQAFHIAQARPPRRALLVGINDYPDPANRLEGCVNDVFLVSSVLQEGGFEAENIRVVLNDRATAAGIYDRLEWLLDGADDGHSRVFYYSGHGAQIPGYGAGEAVDHDDECLVPYDFDWTPQHAIVDDQFHELYSQLPYGTHFLTIFDCCHCGGMAREGAMRARGLNPPDDIRHRMLRWNISEQMWEPRLKSEETKAALATAAGLDEPSHKRFFRKSGVTRRLGCASSLRRQMDNQTAKRCKELGHRGPYMPVILEACQESELAYEYRHGVISHGAFTYALAQTFRNHRTRRLSWQDLIGQVADKLRRLGYAQKPALEGPGKVLSKPIPWRIEAK